MGKKGNLRLGQLPPSVSLNVALYLHLSPSLASNNLLFILLII
jgi:hypothetical protein